MCTTNPEKEFIAVTPHNILLHGDEVVGVKERNLEIMAIISPKDLIGSVIMTDKEKKRLTKFTEKMEDTYRKFSETLYRGKGIALVVLNLGKKRCVLESATISFHDGRSISMLFSKRNNNVATEVMKDMPSFEKLETVEDFVEHAALFKSYHCRKLRRKIDKDVYTMVFNVPQQRDRFSNRKCDEQVVKFCWTCYVEVTSLEKSLCAGCKIARYCTLECQGYDWERHQDFCEKKLQNRIKKMTKKKFVEEGEKYDFKSLE